MPENTDTYDVHTYGDSLKPGRELSIEHSVSIKPEALDISPFVTMKADELEKLHEKSAGKEQAVFGKLRAAVAEWEVLAAETQLIGLAIEYVKTPIIEHSSNKWGKDTYGNDCISNMVYQMSFRIYEDTKYDWRTKKHEPNGFHLTWDVHAKSPVYRGYGGSGKKIAGQDNKRFTDEAAMRKYIDGRISAYSHLFKEISPPIPKEYAGLFSVSGRLLPGYTVEGAEIRQGEQKPSMLGQLAANRENAKAAALVQNKAKTAVPEI
ncbi:hypothetical protein FACS1894104_0520 [Actinomycetota bacterium]|nr:hypothetical protein FACS1894104_0520 [Actinomycetota bacterium]